MLIKLPDFIIFVDNDELLRIYDDYDEALTIEHTLSIILCYKALTSDLSVHCTLK